jgi:hypothetical protein
MESKLQSEAIKWIKSQGAYVIKTRPGAGTPVGCPDIVFFYEGNWGAIEFKRSANSTYQPGQELTLDRLASWSAFIYTAHPNNWPYIKETLSREFF